MPQLKELAIDILTHLTEHLSGNQIDRLWLCGDTILNQKLGVQGAVVSYVQEWSGYGHIYAPQVVLRSTRLRTFDLSVASFCQRARFGSLAHIIERLPPTLTRLALSSFDALASLTGTFQGPLVEQASVLQKLTPLSLATCFPALTHLDINSSVGLTYQFFHTLPPNLEVLIVKGLKCGLVESKLGHLPATLRQLKLDSVLEFDRTDGIRCLPDTLECLTFCSTMPEPLFKLLPRQLKQLHVTHVYTRVREALAYQHLEDLPPNLEKLWMPVKYFTPQDLAKLPRSLLFIMLDCNVDLTDDLVAHLPPNLTKLAMGGEVKVQHMWAQMPRSLQWMGDGTPRHLAASQLSLLPPSLTRFDCRRLILNEDEMAVLPRSLTNLQLSTIDDRTVRHLPPNLRKLRIIKVDCTPDGVAALPRSIREIQLGCNTPLSDAYIQALPQNLETLELVNCSKLQHDDDRPLKYVPKSLRTLRISLSPALGEGTQIAALQSHPNLEHLEFVYYNLPEDCFSALPKSVRTLNVTVPKESTIAPVQLQGLPPVLRVFVLSYYGTLHWLHEDLLYLPRSIVHLQLPPLELTPQALEFLPPYLRELYIAESVPFWFSLHIK